MIDTKKCYLFGRNSQLNDFCIDHGSCSRVHAALVYHKHLNRSFLVDLGSSKDGVNLVRLTYPSLKRAGPSQSILTVSIVQRKTLNSRLFILKPAHGTYIGNIRLEANKPTPLPADSNFHFGASTRFYMIRERPQTGNRPTMDELEKSSGKTSRKLDAWKRYTERRFSLHLVCVMVNRSNLSSPTRYFRLDGFGLHKYVIDQE